MTLLAAALAPTKPPDGIAPILSVRNLQAHFRVSHFGVERYVKAVDGISFDVQRGEIYGLAGESSSGKTTLVKTIAGAIKPPLAQFVPTATDLESPSVLRMKNRFLRGDALLCAVVMGQDDETEAALKDEIRAGAASVA